MRKRLKGGSKSVVPPRSLKEPKTKPGDTLRGDSHLARSRVKLFIISESPSKTRFFCRNICAQATLTPQPPVGPTNKGWEMLREPAKGREAQEGQEHLPGNIHTSLHSSANLTLHVLQLHPEKFTFLQAAPHSQPSSWDGSCWAGSVPSIP